MLTTEQIAKHTQTMKTTPPDTAGYIVCASHRARDKAFGVIGRDRKGYNLAFTEDDIRHHGIYPATADELARCAQIKGVRQLAKRREASLRPCWDFS
jgi:hypothetical protein